jgi:membrane-bound lytic murein transglycosylase D
VDSPVNALQELNPALLRMTTPKDSSYDLRLPGGTAEKYQQTIAGIPRDKRVWWRYHKVSSGETLAEIAKEFRTTQSAIAEVNGISVDDDLNVGDRLIIPVTPRADAQRLAFSKKATIYKVRKGDTVLSVADDFSVPVEKLRQWNRLKGNTLKLGRTLRIYRPTAGAEPGSTHVASKSKGKSTTAAKGKAAQAANRTVHHKVKKGETLTSIAEDYNTTVAALKKANGKSASHLTAGTVLVVKVAE